MPRCQPADLAVISIVVELAVDLGVRPADRRSGTASTVIEARPRRVTTPSSRTRESEAGGAAWRTLEKISMTTMRPPQHGMADADRMAERVFRARPDAGHREQQRGQGRHWHCGRRWRAGRSGRIRVKLRQNMKQESDGMNSSG